jgi:hypothetical protein
MNKLTARGVFISYSRSGGEAFAQPLRMRLEREGIPLWQDRVGLEGGRDWWLQITEALNKVEYMESGRFRGVWKLRLMAGGDG